MMKQIDAPSFQLEPNVCCSYPRNIFVFVYYNEKYYSSILKVSYHDFTFLRFHAPSNEWQKLKKAKAPSQTPETDQNSL